MSVRCYLVVGFIISACFIGVSQAIRCYVCAPVPEIGETCADARDASALDDCGSTTDSCHVLFIKQVNGATEITRNCGKFKGPFQAGNNECKDFVLAHHRTAKLCNCMTDGCNSHTQNPNEVQAQPTATTAPSSGSEKGGNAAGTGDTNKLPIYNPSTLPDSTTKSAAAPQLVLTSLSDFVCILTAAAIAFFMC